MGSHVSKNHAEPDFCMLMSTEKLTVVKQDEYHPSLVLHLMAMQKKENDPLKKGL